MRAEGLVWPREGLRDAPRGGELPPKHQVRSARFQPGGKGGRREIATWTNSRAAPRSRSDARSMSLEWLED